MTIREARFDESEIIRKISHDTISSIYPKYYPGGAVSFFLEHHSIERIEKDISAGQVFICIDDENGPVGTVTVMGNIIKRLFVLPEHQNKGFGRALLNYAEKLAAKDCGYIIIDSSLPAKGIYLKRGYKETEYHQLETANGDYLCYDVMNKIILSER